MSHPARGPAQAGIDGKASAASGRRGAPCLPRSSKEAAECFNP
jgi:hypothetical protein